MFIDESHVTIPQIGAMYRGDRARKDALVEYGFRLPAARDNRPLTFDEFYARVPQIICVSATPVGLPILRDHLVLPCGATGRWVPYA